MLAVDTAWDYTSPPVYENHKICAVPDVAIRGSTTTCSFSIEEARMYFSKTRFTVSTNRNDRCKIVKFRPYWYRRSSDPAFLPPGLADVPDCSKPGTDLSPRCFGGAAVYLVSGFPQNRGIAYMTYNSQKFTLDIKSEFELKHYLGFGVNYLIANDLTDRATQVTSGPKAYEGSGEFQDYQLICEDEWGYPWHTLTVTIADEDKDGADSDPEDEYEDWN